MFAAALAIGLVTRAPYLDLPFVEDDYDFLYQLGLARAGKLPTFFVLLAPQGPHPMFLWKTVYFIEWRLFGLEPLPWHLVAAAIHALGVTALFIVLSRYLDSRLGAWTGALLWAGAAIGNWDNPHAWLMCGMIPLATTALLAAMALLPRIHDPADRGGPWWFALALTIALLSWGDVLAFLPILALQWLILERPSGGSVRPPRRWLLAGVIPTVFLGAAQVALVVPQLNEADRQRAFDPADVAGRTAGQLGVALATLTHADLDPRAPNPVAPKIAIAVLAIAGIGLLPPRSRRVFLVFFLWGSLYAALTNIGGATIDFAAAVHSGHYLYLPTLSWSVLLGALAGAFIQRWPRLGTAGIVVAIAWFAVHQSQIARSTRAFTLATFAEPTQAFIDNRALLAELSGRSRAQGRPLRLVEFPVPLAAATSAGFWPASSFVAIADPGNDRKVEVVPLDRASDRDFSDLLRLLRGARSPLAPLWIERIERTRNYGQGFLWLSQFAARNGGIIELPDFWISEGSLRCKAGPFLAFAFESAPPGLVLSPNATRQRMLEWIQRLRASPDVAARTWVDLLTNLSKDLP